MVYACFRKFGLIILWLIQAHNARDSKMLKYLEVVLWGVTSSVPILRVDGSHEGNELIWNDYIHVPVFYFLVILVFFVVKFSEIIPSVTHPDLQALEALED